MKNPQKYLVNAPKLSQWTVKFREIFTNEQSASIQQVSRPLFMIMFLILFCSCGVFVTGAISDKRINKMSNTELDNFCKKQDRIASQDCGRYYYSSRSAEIGCENGKASAKLNQQKCYNVKMRRMRNRQ